MVEIIISSMSQRKGRKLDLPELDPAQFGFTTDTGELFIGSDPETSRVQNRTTFPFKNIKVLTEFDVAHHLTGTVYHHGPLFIKSLVADNTDYVLYDWDVAEVRSIILDYSFFDNLGDNGQIGSLYILTNGTKYRLKVVRTTLEDNSTITLPSTVGSTDTHDTRPDDRLQFKLNLVGSKLELLAQLNTSGADGSVGGDGEIKFFARCWR